MLQLVYVSTTKTIVDQALLDAILESSRRNNAVDGVTGLLVSGGRRFLQVLEGPDQAVLRTYGRIQHDDRHFAFVLIACQTVRKRSFGDWSMAHRAGDWAGADARLEQAVETLTAQLDPNLRAQFTGFVKLHRRAA
jgi:hypothetical protein